MSRAARQMPVANVGSAPLRFVTAASLFDGHDASINLMRRLLQSGGAEVVHLGHNRSVAEIVEAAIQEDAHAIAISSYQGGHVEYFRYVIESLAERGASAIRVFGGGGGVIVQSEIDELHAAGVERIYSPEDGQRLGLKGMIDHMLDATRSAWNERTDTPNDPLGEAFAWPGEGLDRERHAPLARLLTAIQNDMLDAAALDRLVRRAQASTAPVLGITGTGGAGKSSVTDELLRRFQLDREVGLSIALLAIDPTRRRSGGALLGDRIRMNSLGHDKVFMRSVATRDARGEVPESIRPMIAACRLAGADLVIVETPGIGQGDAGIVELADVSLYVMTPEFGAASQLEKIDMLDFADVVAINKLERKGGDDALRDVAKQMQRNREAFGDTWQEMPVHGTIAARFNDDGVTALYHSLADLLEEKGLVTGVRRLERPAGRHSTRRDTLVPVARQRYLADIATCVRDYHTATALQAGLARDVQRLGHAAALLVEAGTGDDAPLRALADSRAKALVASTVAALEGWPARRDAYAQSELETEVRARRIVTSLKTTTMSGTALSRVALPRYSDDGDLLAWLRRENLPGHFPYTAGVFPFKRSGEDPTRMFAGEGDAFRTNRRFHAVSRHAPAKRLSTAFDSVTLYGQDPAERPDIFGKIGNAGVSIATVEDMQALYDGFDLVDPATSVSMTINGPAPTVLAFFFLAAIRQQHDRFVAENGREPDAGESEALRARTLASVRGTVQADILKEDQGQNTCLFSTEFSLKLMADMQAWFIEHDVRNFYSVSISGYHIAEAGANPITQLALTLSNGFTYVESYLARSMAVDDFAPNLSFFFSNGMDPEYCVLGRVARRIWAIAMRDRYGANERSQKLKYHVQTSGRSLHAQEMDFNDIRTTLQALIAVYDNCNSLHTNAYDEAVTTPTDASVRRAMAIQMIINREWGLAGCENPLQGSFVIEELTELVEEAVLTEFDRISDRGGVLGAMETGYQRGRIQDESMKYEQAKHDGSLPIIGVNTFRAPDGDAPPDTIELARSSETEKRSQISRLVDFQARHAEQAPTALAELQRVALEDGNVFDALMHAAAVCSLGQITDALFEVGGAYRRML